MEELYQYDPRNRLTGYTKGGVTTQFTYDKAGNLLKDDKARYFYDAFNCTEKVETFDGHVHINRYDAEGLRHEMEEDGKLVQFIFCGDEIVTEETENKVIRIIRGYDLVASDAESARTYYHYASDEMSSITHVVEETNVLNHYEYDAWGNTTVCEETVENRFRFNGQQLDPITQQYYLRARFYNPVIARFTQEDTYRGDGLNLYAYCVNNPVYYEDPSGHWCDRKEKVYKDLLKERGITEADLANDPDLKLSLMAEASNIVKSQKRTNSSENKPNAPEASNQNAESGRNSSGVVTGSGNGNVSRMMRGTQGNIGLIPKGVADKLSGRSFNNFGEFRSAFWKEIANSSYAREFSTSNITRMSKGLAPKVSKSQQYGKLSSYVLHHKTPIHAGGGVYNLDNLVIVTPRMHQEILDKAYHFGN